jgi:hypothetical protein
MKLLELNSNLIILVIVDRLIKMAHSMSIKQWNPPTVAKLYVDNVWKYLRFVVHLVSDQNGTITGQYISEFSNYL